MSTNNINFFTKLEDRVKEINSLLCIGLDPHLNEVFRNKPISTNEEERCDAAFTFCKTIIDATGKDLKYKFMKERKTNTIILL